jgi:hypothetical protein
MKLYEFKKRTAEPQNIEYRMSKGRIASLNHFYKIDRIHYFDIRHMSAGGGFIIRYSLFQSFFSIRLAAFQASGIAET